MRKSNQILSDSVIYKIIIIKVEYNTEFVNTVRVITETHL